MTYLWKSRTTALTITVILPAAFVAEEVETVLRLLPRKLPAKSIDNLYWVWTDM